VAGGAEPALLAGKTKHDGLHGFRPT
jgi:hypothetical protein